MMVRFFALLTAVAPIFWVNTLSAAELNAVGLWQQFDDVSGKSEGWFLISEYDGIYEGAIAKMFMKPGENPNPICTHCEGGEKNSPWLGLTIIKGMKRNGMKYEDGTILDPRNGTVYKAIMELSPDEQTLTVRGYLGIPLLGRDQVWKRLPDSAQAELDPVLRLKYEMSKPSTAKKPVVHPLNH
jgi:uncharacterized protein (DUF2147 family)